MYLMCLIGCNNREALLGGKGHRIPFIQIFLLLVLPVFSILGWNTDPSKPRRSAISLLYVLGWDTDPSKPQGSAVSRSYVLG